jgi:hypothetical protein
MLVILLATGCEEKRYGISSDDATPPGQPVFLRYTPLNGSVRLFYRLPGDEDLLSVDAEYVTASGKTLRFSASYFVDSLDVYGFGDMESHTLKLFAVDRAGNRSAPVDVDVVPLEPAISRVANTVYAGPGFGSFFVDWSNELEASINVYVDFTYRQDGNRRSLTSVFSSNLPHDRQFVYDLETDEQEPMSISVRVGDTYGNVVPSLSNENIMLYTDALIPKDNWILPEAGFVKGAISQVFANNLEGRLRYVADGIIDRERLGNYILTPSLVPPWSIMIDLGDWYELSRIVTHQRHYADDMNTQGEYYRSVSIGIYNMYIWDDALNDWEYASQHKIPIPENLSEFEIVKMGQAGDKAYLYPDEPRFTRPTRWFRYEAYRGFLDNYTNYPNTLSEITLYGRKASR